MNRTVKLIALLFPLAAATAYEVTIHQNSFRTTYETVKLPNNEDMGFIGINYLYESNIGFYYGLGVYGAMTGQRGGFFTGGLEVGYQLHLHENIALDLGVFGGGGGGGAAAQGGGLMLRPHAGLIYDANDYRVGLTYSQVEFPNGNISSNQMGLQLEIPFQTVTADMTDSARLYKGLLEYSDTYDFGWVDHYFAATFQQYFPLSGTTDTSGQKNTKTISLIGFEYGSYFNPRWFVYMETAGAFQGGAGGYAEVLSGLGYDLHLNRSLGLKAKAALGSAGGGQINTGGGFVYKANLAAYYKPIEQLTINAETGFMHAPDGDFMAQIAKLSLAYNLTFLGIGNNIRHVNVYKKTTSGEWNFRLVNQHYLASDTIRYNGIDDPVDLIGLKIDRYLNDNVYVTGQAYGAYEGDVGGYASGLVGLGYRTPKLLDKISGYVELLGGAGGGGGVASEGGALIQPMAGISYEVSKDFDIQFSIGKVDALKGSLDTTVSDIGIVYKFRTLEK